MKGKISMRMPGNFTDMDDTESAQSGMGPYLIYDGTEAKVLNEVKGFFSDSKTISLPGYEYMNGRRLPEVRNTKVYTVKEYHTENIAAVAVCGALTLASTGMAIASACGAFDDKN